MFGTALALSLIAALPAGHSTVDPHQFLQEEAGDNYGDWTPAFKRMLEACTPAGAGAERYREYRGCRIELACDYSYLLSEPIVLDRAHVIVGCGGQGAWGNTILKFAGDGLIVRAAATIRDVHIMGSSSSTTTTGIFASGPVRLEDVQITDFGRGVHIQAAAAPSCPTCNANAWYAANVTMPRMNGYGWYVEGADSNAGVAVGLNIANSCTRAKSTDAQDSTGHICWGLRDRSFLGNTYVAPHTAYSWSWSDNSRFPQYIIEGANAGTTLVNPYQETQQEGSILTGRGLALSGSLQNLGAKQFLLLGRSLRGSVFIPFNDGTPSNLLFGEGGAMRLLSEKGIDFRLVYDASTATLAWRARGAGPGDLAITDTLSQTAQKTPLLPGRAWIGRSGSYYAGPPNGVVAVIWGAAEDPNQTLPKCGAYPAGSTYRSVRPTKPGAWTCLCDGREKPTADGSCPQGASWVHD